MLLASSFSQESKFLADVRLVMTPQLEPSRRTAFPILSLPNCICEENPPATVNPIVQAAANNSAGTIRAMDLKPERRHAWSNATNFSCEVQVRENAATAIEP